MSENLTPLQRVRNEYTKYGCIGYGFALNLAAESERTLTQLEISKSDAYKQAIQDAAE